jgi:acetyl/propionyl-CoA carboxylase alpha subunit
MIMDRSLGLCLVGRRADDAVHHGLVDLHFDNSAQMGKILLQKAVLQFFGQPIARGLQVRRVGEEHRLGLIVERIGNQWKVTTRGAAHGALVLPLRLARHESLMLEKVPPDLSRLLICPMPGMLVKLHVAEGETVQPGQPLATVEAMKMENILRAEKEGVIAKINAAEGESLAVDAVILELE